MLFFGALSVVSVLSDMCPGNKLKRPRQSTQAARTLACDPTAVTTVPNIFCANSKIARRPAQPASLPHPVVRRLAGIGAA
jgi:hypothetical protein